MRSLYDTPGRDETHGAAFDEAARNSGLNDWRNNGFKTKRVRLTAIKAVVGDDDELVERVLELIRNQSEY